MMKMTMRTLVVQVHLMSTLGGDEMQMFVRSVASRHEHDMHKDDDQVSVSSAEHEGNENGIGSFGGHVPVESRIDM